ncbi:uncharacterized protein IL334_001699 [Kwoniella shivajii]|uniref:Uncharacterized protein n=1 Tax=Kwoniella shivajii TaxID=564305 RepID=A0ABZ1CSM9_9TREE|nr:hypothetical protein IL334_001699 [Kwoniella shivajii]
MPSTPFFISDTSPLISYSPDGSWTGAYRAKGDGWDETFHTTSSSEAIISVNITASALNFHITSPSVDSDTCEIQYRLNGSDWSDGCTSSNTKYVTKGLPRGIHEIEMKGREGGKGLEFLGISGELPILNPGTAINQTIDNLSSLLTYTPSDQWTKMNTASDGLVEPYANYTFKTMYDNEGLNEFYGNSMAGTTVQDAKVDLRFQAEAVYVYGLSGPSGGSAEILLDGEIQNNINTLNPWEIHGSLLYAGGGFDPNITHTLSFVNTQQGGQLIIDYALLTISQKGKTSNLPFIAGISGGVSALLIIIGFIWWSITYKNRNKNKKRSNTKRQKAQYVFANGIGKDGFISKSSSINVLSPISGFSESISGSGRSLNPSDGEYIWGTGRPAGLDLNSNRTPNISQSQSQSQSQSNTRTQTQTQTQTHTRNAGLDHDSPPPFRSPPPDYPDYIPYYPPNTSSSAASPSASNVGSGKSAYYNKSPHRPEISADSSGWIHNASKTLSPSPSMKSRASPLIERMNPLSSARSNKPEYDDIALDNYSSYSRSEQRSIPITPPPIPSEYGDYTPTTSTTPYSKYTTSPSTASTDQSVAVQSIAKRGSKPPNVARLWPSRDAVPSAYQNSLATTIKTEPSLHRMNTTGGQSSIAPYPPGSSINLPSMQESIISPSAPESPMAGARAEGGLGRGASIKSSKSIGTMRSWFSGLIFAPPGSNSGLISSLPSVPSTPILPQAAARPDSGIFPLALNGSVGSIPLRSSPAGTPTQMVPGTATRSIFSSPLTARTMGSGYGYGYGYGGNQTPRSGNNSPFANLGNVNGMNTRPLPSRSTTDSSGYTYGSNEGNNMFIELNPNSPIGESRPGSEWTNGGKLY